MDVTREVTFASTDNTVVSLAGVRGDPWVDGLSAGTVDIFIQVSG
jgi:hypothetical protein